MKKRVIDAALLLCLISFIIACGAKREDTVAAPVVDKAQIKKEIQAKENQFAELYNTGQFKSIGYYADSAISFSQNKKPLIGKPAIIEYLKAGIDSSSTGNKIAFTTNEVFVSNDGNQVVEIGYYNLADSMNVSVNTGHYMVLFEKRNGKYVVLRDMSACDIPLE